MGDVVVVQAGDPRRARLEAEGWTVTARSFGAQLDAGRVDVDRLESLVAGVDAGLVFRALSTEDVDAVLVLDRLTEQDYPGSLATQHEPLSRETATPAGGRRAFGALDAGGALLAMTFLEVDGEGAETDFTVVHPSRRRQGVGAALKAFSVLALVREGLHRLRTGGSADNVAILRANASLGYVQDETWVTLTTPDRTPAAT